MNYYERHLGDYARDAGHLSMLEHGAYSLLLDRSYATEQPIPSRADAYRICRARSRQEKEAVDNVLREFFLTDGEAFINRRVEEEIAKARVRIDAARENGRKGGRPPKETQQEPSGLLPGSIPLTQVKALQTPSTSSNTSDPSGSGAGAPPVPADVIFGRGVPLLTAASVSERNARSMLGLMRKTHGDDALIHAIQRCAEEKPLDPVSWLQAALKSTAVARPRKADDLMAGNIAAIERYMQGATR